MVGQLWDQDQIPAKIRDLGLDSCVRLLGRLDDAPFDALMATTDIGLALRRPPTYGETSGVLLSLLAHGVATIVVDTDTFGDYPTSAVRKVAWDRDGMDGLMAALRELAGSPARRHALGDAGRSHVTTRQSWPRVAEQYAELIEDVHARRLSGRHRALRA
jgi:glycosyltransferase involved in cell wall biosynthesis